MSATPAQIFKFLWFMPSLGVRSPFWASYPKRMLDSLSEGVLTKQTQAMGLPRNNLFRRPWARQCSGCGRRGASGTRGATPPPPPTTSRVSHDLRCFHSCNWGHGLGSYSQCSVLPTDYGHTMAKFLILCGPNSNPNSPNAPLFICPSTKVWDFNEKKASLGVSNDYRAPMAKICSGIPTPTPTFYE